MLGQGVGESVGNEPEPVYGEHRAFGRIGMGGKIITWPSFWEITELACMEKRKGKREKGKG